MTQRTVGKRRILIGRATANEPDKKTSLRPREPRLTAHRIIVIQNGEFVSRSRRCSASDSSFT
jgi:hypothetical protein